MRGENRPDLQLVQRSGDLVCIKSRLAKALDRPFRRCRLRRLVSRARIASSPANAMNLLCRVDEQEEKSESACSDAGELGSELIDTTNELLEIWRALRSPSPCTAVLAKTVNNLECASSLEPLDRLAESVAQTTNILVKRNVFVPRVRLERRRAASFSFQGRCC